MSNRRFFKITQQISVWELAHELGLMIPDSHQEKSKNCIIQDVATLDTAKSGDLAFFANHKYFSQLADTEASACILSSNEVQNLKNDIIPLVSDKPYLHWAMALDLLFDDVQYYKNHSITKRPQKQDYTVGKNVEIADDAIISAGAEIGDNCVIGFGVYIGPNVKIGPGSVINPSVTITHAELASNCIIHSGARIGQEGFGFAPGPKGIVKVKQLGGVKLGNGVEIGANSCVDRGAIEDTIIGDFVKIDNMVQIAHNVKVGPFTVIAGCAAIAGSTEIGSGVMIGGKVGISGHLKVADGSSIAGGSLVVQDILTKQAVGGSPAVPIRDWHKQTIALRKLIENHKNKK